MPLVSCRRCDASSSRNFPVAMTNRTLIKSYMLFLARCARLSRVINRPVLSYFLLQGLLRRLTRRHLLALTPRVRPDRRHRSRRDPIRQRPQVSDAGLSDRSRCHPPALGRPERTIESFQGFFTVIGDELASKIVFVCSDMWEPYLKVIREKCSEALHILDRFHIVAKMNKALDEVRAGESRRRVDMLSAEEPGIQRPGARADHRQGCAEDPEDGRKGSAVRDRKCNPRLHYRC